MRILVLCDGGGPLGVGHVIRSLALAEASVAAGHSVVVAGHFEGAFVRGQLALAPVEVVQLVAPMADGDLQLIVDLVRTLRPDVLHVDSYEAPGLLGELVESPGVEPGFGILALGGQPAGNVLLSNMEDGSFGRRPADVVLDPTIGAELSPRPDDGSTLLLRGSRYAPIRQRVLDARRSGQADTAHDAAARSVLVVMGGTDPVGLAPVAVELLAGTGLALDVTVIAVGEIAERVRAAAEGSSLSLSVLAPVDDLAALMVRQDLVVSAAGTSVGELCCLGVPMALVWAVGNQREGYDRVVAAGAAVGLGGPELGEDQGAVGSLRRALTDSQARADLVLAGRQVVDGLGAWRVVRTWEMARRSVPAMADPGRLVARAATLGDARLLWEWRNDPATRESSRSTEEVPWDDHLAWLADSLDRTDRMLLLVEDEAGPIGTVRWDLTRDREGEREWEVSITVAPQRRRQSLARPLLRAGEEALSAMARSSATDVTAYLAVVHIDNDASVRLFETSAYIPDAPPDHRGFMRFRKAAPVA
ncbi:MAG TPA: bifunctional UDP-2,4-diacetamido-2,4,6-trideoxy-beta-L-altropyranose hydrolase/GNAT family N-acetyltransferase [Dermatophilaceae bacterium]